MGEGTFVSLLSFLERHAPDPLTRRIAHLTRNDEARAVERRHRELQSTAGLNEGVFGALVLLAAGNTTPATIHAGWQHVQTLQHDMADARQARLTRLGFTTNEAETLSALHTRNFM